MKQLKQAVLVIICAMFLVSQIGCAKVTDGLGLMETKESGALTGAAAGVAGAHALGAGYPGNKWMYGAGAIIGAAGGFFKGKENEMKKEAAAAELSKQQ